MSWIEWSDSKFRNLDLTQLKVDHAYLNISNQRKERYFLYSLSEECIKCPYRFVKKIGAENDTLLKLNIARSFELRLFKKDHGPYVDPNFVNDDLYWSDEPDMGEFGVYDLIIKKSGPTVFETAKEPVNTISCRMQPNDFFLQFFDKLFLLQQFS